MSDQTAGATVDEFDSQLNDPNQYDNPQDPARLAVVEHLRSLSIFGKLTLLYVFTVLVYLLIKCHWVIALMSTVAFLISAVPLFIWWGRIRFSCPLDLVVRSFGLGIIGMFWSVFALLIVCAMGPVGLILNMLFGSLAGLARFIILVGLEEMMKVILARWIKRDVAIGRETKAHQIVAVSTSVGYAVGFSFFMIILLDELVDHVLDIKKDSLDDLLVGLFALLVTTTFGTPLHVLSGYLVGLEVTRQTPFMKAGLYSFTLRSLFQLNIIIWIIITGPFWQMLVFGILVTNILICIAMVRRIKKVESTLPIEYLQRVGYLQAFGYGVLPGGDVDEVEIPSNVDVNTLV